MRNKILENSLFTLAGGLVLAAVELKLVQMPEILLIVLSFIGFAALLQGIFGLCHLLTTKEDSK